MMQTKQADNPWVTGR